MDFWDDAGTTATKTSRTRENYWDDEEVIIKRKRIPAKKPPQHRRMTKPLKAKGKRPKNQAFWVYDPESKRRYHPSTWRSMVVRGLVIGGSVALGRWLLGGLLPMPFDPAPVVENAVGALEKFASNLLDIFD